MINNIKSEEIPVFLSEEDKDIWRPFTKDGKDYVIVELYYNDDKEDYSIRVRTNHPLGRTTLCKFGFTEDEKVAKMVFAETCDIIMTTEFLDDLVEFYDFEW